MFSPATTHLAQVDLWVARIQSEATQLRKNPNARVRVLSRDATYVGTDPLTRNVVPTTFKILLKTTRNPCGGRPYPLWNGS